MNIADYHVGYDATHGTYIIERSYGPGRWKAIGRRMTVNGVVSAIRNSEAARDPQHTRIARVKWYGFRDKADEDQVRSETSPEGT